MCLHVYADVYVVCYNHFLGVFFQYMTYTHIHIYIVCYARLQYFQGQVFQNIVYIHIYIWVFCNIFIYIYG